MEINEILSGMDLSKEEEKELSLMFSQGNDLMQHFILEDNEFKLKVNIVNKSDNPLPTYAKHGDSGFDLRANLPDGSMIIESGKIGVVPTGLFFQIPLGWELQVRPRSGLAVKNGVSILNSPGTVDSGFRGEVKAIIFNTGAIGDFTINHGDRICQGVIMNVVHNAKFIKVETLEDSERGEGGFGHSGLK
jgi:dUTP pyrophosphatase